MTIQEIITYLIEGKKCRKSNYAYNDYISLNNKGILVYSDGFIAPISKNDLISDNWELYQETFDFQKAVELLKDGKTVKRSGRYNELRISEGKLVNQVGHEIFIPLGSIQAKDWIEVEPKND